MFKDFNWATFWATLFALFVFTVILLLAIRFGTTTAVYALDANGKPTGKAQYAIVCTPGSTAADLTPKSN